MTGSACLWSRGSSQPWWALPAPESPRSHMLGGLDRPDEGKVYVDGKDIFSLKEEALTIFRRRKIGFVIPVLQSGAGAERL